MTQPPESTHERLNRELAKHRTRSIGFWGGWALLIGILGLYGFLNLNKPAELRFVTGIAGASMQLASETGTVLVTRVTVEGHEVDIRLRSQLIHPVIGETICLSAGERRFSGQTSYTIVSHTLCDDPSATPPVD